MRYEKIHIICWDCRKEADSWDLCIDERGLAVGMCLKCSKEQMDPINYQEFMDYRKEKPGVDRYEIV